MGKKTKQANDRLKRGGFKLPSPREVMAAMTPAGAWTARQLAEWGVSWPPTHGWRRDLQDRWEALNGKETRTSGAPSLLELTSTIDILRAVMVLFPREAAEIKLTVDFLDFLVTDRVNHVEFCRVSSDSFPRPQPKLVANNGRDVA